MRVIDLRSDTVTHPTDEMRRVMADAEVGDDVFAEDPSINRLQERAAELLGKEAGLLTPSGTMSNLIAGLTYCHRGDEVVMGDQAHIFWNESAGVAALAGAQLRLIPNGPQGRIEAADLEAVIRPPGNIHFPPTTLVCLENTHNRCGGGVQTPEDTGKICEVAHAAGASVHMDGARIFNAAVALEVPAAELVKDVDDVSFCLSKGLSCPVGSVICGSKEFIDQARRWRKMVGGGMRQAGVLAAAGLVALDTMIERLAEDHARARQLAGGLANIDGLDVDPDAIQTNIIIFDVNPALGPAAGLIGALAREGVKVSSPGKHSIRMVTHRHISGADVEEALARTSKAVKELR
ncbi:MAG: GntG family PLP-dependent aldolase [Dehalococcoidia bacterium]|nr:GntG family PLP-dependent aldolase [Dehalococcoidia bacterium]MDP6227297.1 GntG family PLP-dependent aldolase [Dehalococcoidia bacterium]MDP7083554.1 GntG family PLP-dependent aldolase [Dehalococcoidia bacterium]MDP7199352.1 GntG family PLP-dependent aldolase [Dehalococcoidia bacterium]MDP7510052.1 GntG family PLP-dependent aldolase [Dehalococcoidia bacterium]